MEILRLRREWDVSHRVMPRASVFITKCYSNFHPGACPMIFPFCPMNHGRASRFCGGGLRVGRLLGRRRNQENYAVAKERSGGPWPRTPTLIISARRQKVITIIHIFNKYFHAAMGDGPPDSPARHGHRQKRTTDFANGSYEICPTRIGFIEQFRAGPVYSRYWYESLEPSAARKPPTPLFHSTADVD